MTSAEILTGERVARDIADILETPASELDYAAKVSDVGLDSLTLITLVEEWRAVKPDLNFQELMAKETLGEWVDAVTDSAPKI